MNSTVIKSLNSFPGNQPKCPRRLSVLRRSVRANSRKRKKMLTFPKCLNHISRREKHTPKSPAARIAWVNPERNRANVLDIATVTQMICLAKDNLLDKTIMIALYTTGARLHDLLSLKVCDIDWRLPGIWLQDKRLGKRIFCISPECESSLKRFLEWSNNKAPYVFANHANEPFHTSYILRRLQKYANKLKIDCRLNQHSFTKALDFQLLELQRRNSMLFQYCFR